MEKFWDDEVIVCFPDVLRYRSAVDHHEGVGLDETCVLSGEPKLCSVGWKGYAIAASTDWSTSGAISSSAISAGSVQCQAYALQQGAVNPRFLVTLLAGRYGHFSRSRLGWAYP